MGGQGILIAGLLIFVGVHLLPALGVRAAIVARLDENRFKAVFAIVALVGLGLVIYGKADAAFVHLWSPPVWGRHVAWLMMLPALFLIIAANMPGNVKRFTPHPMMWAVVIWAISHLLANGDLASLLLFGAMGLFGVIHIVSANMRGASVQTMPVSAASDLKILAIAVVSYVLLAFAHPYLFRVPAFV